MLLRYTLFLALCAIGTSLLYSQDLVLSHLIKNKQRIVEIGETLEFTYLNGTQDSKCSDSFLRGTYLGIRDQQVLVKPTYYSFFEPDPKYAYRQVEYKFDLNSTAPNDEMVANLNNISRFTRQKKGRENRANFGAFLTALGYTTALVVAPLASYNYGNGGFNSDRYLSWAGTGLLTGTVGLVYYWLNNRKAYWISPCERKRNVPESRQWQLEVK